MVKADKVAGMVTIFVGAVLLITIWPVAKLIGVAQPVMVQSLVQSFVGIVLLKYGFQAMRESEL